MSGGERDGGHGQQRQPGLAGLDAAMLRARTAAWRRLRDTTAARTAAHLAARAGQAWVGWSGGKDSSTVADLAHRAAPGIPVVHFDCGLDFPENTAYMQQVARDRGWNLVVISGGDGLAAMRATGAWEHGTPDGDPGALAAYWQVIMAVPSAEAARRFGPHLLTGLRAAESAARAASLGRAAGHARLAGGVQAWSPVGHWQAADIWAYHHARGIPLNPVYARLRQIGAPEAAQRVGLAIGADGLGAGRAVWLRRGWPGLWERYCEALPRLREFA